MGGAVILALIAFLLLRRRRRDDFDGDFDPDRVVGGRRAGGVDLVGGEGAQVEPYNYVPSSIAGRQQMSEAGTGSLLGAGAAGLGAGMAAGSSQKRPPPGPASNGTSGPPSAPSAYSGSQSHYAPSSSDPGYDYAAYAAYSDPHSGSMSGHGYDSTSPRSSAFPGGFNPAYLGPDGAYRGGPSPGPSLPGTGSSSAGMNFPSSKEMEARGLRVANEPGTGEGSGVVQHQDAGRVPVAVDESPSEIPPSYDSIRRD